MEDRQIIELYNSRDELAIKETDRKYGSYCMRIAMNILANREDSEECVNDTWIKTWNSIPPQAPSSLKAYVGRITRNLAYNVFKLKTRKKRGGNEAELALEEIETVISSDSRPDVEYNAAELAKYINRFLGTLSKRDRNIMVCRYYFLYPISKIAKCHALTESHTRTILSRSLSKLKEFLIKEKYI